MRTSAGLFLFLIIAICCAQAPISASTPARPTTTYHSDAMNFDFVYPSSFTGPKDTAEDQGKSSEAGKTGPGCVSVPVAVMDMRVSFNMIFLKRYDLACLGKEITAAGLGTAVANVLTDTLQGFGKPTLSSSTDYDITGRSASTVSGSVKVPHAKGKSVIYAAASCVISGKNVACFQFLSNDCPNVAALSASTVKFTDSLAAPIIPAELVHACKP
jgi:hypothetical protein